MNNFSNFNELAAHLTASRNERAVDTNAYDGNFIEHSEMAKLTITDAPMSMEMPAINQEKEYDHDLAARCIVENCFRNGKLEDYHTGIYPRSATGDYSDVKVVTPFGEIPWDKLSRLNDIEMRELMIDAVNKTYTFLTFSEQLSIIRDAKRWNKAKFDDSMLYVVEAVERTTR